MFAHSGAVIYKHVRRNRRTFENHISRAVPVIRYELLLRASSRTSRDVTQTTARDYSPRVGSRIFSNSLLLEEFQRTCRHDSLRQITETVTEELRYHRSRAGHSEEYLYLFRRNTPLRFLFSSRVQQSSFANIFERIDRLIASSALKCC